ncbi:2-oxoglutarate dehydrogenase complex dihydrolipoyllysine-residue succinyltransferase [Rhodocytophaga aerolata]|uniref:Dihydrolipoyllysine-residue succinyltransferase component of 2-oxoglutarate dehydrogenase complex n=1 Tax=Rhodocytophaga aerolata TaxID=455078 RepID=A0ABT8R5U9_9BACT|nr:2-oxoglutarate dehydrogenase complex dihydrolipoyllysine-residue succinyltransferase [Rhodocytophaga aerolata]MDO1446648.1 2-oxoglutarate dehydrogenase complex dihydrolipoyllysine-residue succinyltransferase [Rhodocytophaga aerolata]
MSLEVKVPSVGESITEVTIASWHKRDGDSVNADDVLCELESDKATFELNAESAGILRILVQEGETVPIGTLICRIEEKNGVQPAAKPVEKAAPKVEPTTPNTNRTPAITENKTQSMQETPQTTEVVEMKVPAVGESISEVTIANWTKKDGDQVQLDDVLCEIESDKATFELTAEASGTLRIVAQAGTTLAIGDLICKIEKGAAAGNGTQGGGVTPSKEMYSAPKEVLKEENKKSEEPGTQPAQTTPVADNQKTSSTSYATGHASPAAAKILAEKGIYNKEIKGTGIDGRITKADAVQAEKTQPKAPAGPQETAKPAVNQATASVPGSREQRRQKMTQLRKTVSRRLVAVKNETAMLTTFNEVDMKPIMEMRAKYKDKFKEKYNVGLGFMSFFTKAVCVALQEWPAVNAMIDGDEIVYNDFVDISIAVSAPKGLVVPVVRNAEQLSFAQIEAEIIRLAGRARDNKMTIEEMTGGTFTITNGGVFGSMMSTPIINAPQSAILGMHNIIERPVAINGQVEIRPMMYVALSYDHRIIDGRESVSFLVRVKQLLEDPARLLLGI